jgi:proteic killer suppression protein
MIKTFRHKGLEQFFLTGSRRGIPAEHARRLQLQLVTLNAARHAQAMNIPGWNLHPLHKELAGHWAVKVSDNWRLTFTFEEENAVLVDYQDYH